MPVTALSCGLNLTLIQNEVYALSGASCNVTAGAVLQRSDLYAGPFADWVGSTSGVYNNSGGFVKCVTGNTSFLAKRTRMGAPSVPYGEQIIAHGASNYWKLDETSGLTAVDIKSGINATISGGVTLNQAGISGGKSMLYNGTDGKLVTTGNVTVPLSCSVEAWIKTNFNDPSFKAIFSVRTLTVESILVSTNNGVVYVYCAPTALLSIRTIYDNNWHHVVFVSDGTNGWLYIDGTLDNTSSNLMRVSTSSPAGIGFEPGRAAGYYWNGSIDEVAIYPRALTPAEIQSHYKAR